jgi:ribonuclease D
VRGLQLKRGPQLDGMLAAVRAGDEITMERPAETSAELRTRLRAVLPLASAVLQARCGAAGIASELVATRDDLETLIRHQAGEGTREPALLSGWRRELAGDSLMALLRGEVVLRVTDGPPHVSEQPV